MPWPSCGDVQPQILSQDGLAIAGLAVHAAGFAVAEEIVDQPFLVAVGLELREEQEPALALELHDLGVEGRVVRSEHVHHTDSLRLSASAHRLSSQVSR